MLVQFCETVEETTLEVSDSINKGYSAVADLPDNFSEVGDYLKKLLTMLEEFAVTYGGRLLIALVVLIVGFKLINAAVRKLKAAKAMQKIEPSARQFLLAVMNVVLKIIVGITALAIMGVPMTSIIAVVGSCGLAIGLALQGSLANIAGGFVLMLTRPFKVGDFLKFNDTTGTVEEIGIFHTKILTIDNRRVVVPNATISNSTLVNFFALPESRVDLTFTASYSDDVDKVERVLLNVCDRNEKIMKDPAPFARVSAHKDSAIEYTVRAWVNSADYWQVCFDLQHDVKRAFDENGITIPFPQVDVHTK
ncbi:MAG: mechanosensitive ion channel [Clostridia bacterium]|nr:mechanosensitive ion channel [Clostridia bacterium]MBR5410380.1 mechanosensitive ion channel [Clostridia bacterium]